MRAWPFPDLRDGATFHLITDTHFGAAAHAGWVNDWLDNTREDMELLKVVNTAGHVHAGDMIHWYDGAGNTAAGGAQEDAWYVAWRDAIRADDGLPFAEAVGNHDLLGPGDPDTARVPRTAAEWAAAVGTPSHLMFHDMGEIAVATLAPDVWAFGTPFTLPQATLDWLDATLQAAGKPTFVACHLALDEQYPDRAATVEEEGNPGIVAVIDANPNCVGWLSGHYHVIPEDEPDHIRSMQVGSRRIFGVNGPPAGGGRYATVSYANHRWQQPNLSMFVTYTGDAIDVRWRDHNKRSWFAPNGQRVGHVLLTA